MEVIYETLICPNIEVDEAYSVDLVPESNRISLILCYLQSGDFPSDEEEARNIRRKIAKYTLLSRKLYRMVRATPMLRRLDECDIILVLAEVHKGVCNNYTDKKALAHKLLRANYY